jgi:hypothetical protein
LSNCTHNFYWLALIWLLNPIGAALMVLLRRSRRAALQGVGAHAVDDSTAARSFTVSGERDDARRFLASQLPDWSRTRIQELIDEGARVSGRFAPGASRAPGN